MQLNIPSDDIVVDAEVPSNPRQVRKWLKDLPQVNIGETTRQFYTILAKINRLSISARDRMEIMEMMRPTGHMVHKNLRKYMVARTFPLPSKTRKIMQLTQALLGELALGYKMIARDSAFGESRLDAKSVTTCIHRAIRYLGEQLQLSAQVYTPDPRGVWQDIHQLFNFAENHRLLKKTIADDSYVEIQGSSISEAYRQVCLLALSRPVGLRQGEARRLAAFYETACKKVSVSADSTPDAEEGVYFAHVASDSAPGYIAATDLAEADDNRFFNLNKLCVDLKERIQNTRPGAPDTIIQVSVLSSDLSRRLLTNLTTMAKRRFSRASKDYEVRVAIGINNIYRAIHHDEDPLEYEYSGQADGPPSDLDMQQLELEPTAREPDSDPGYVIGPRSAPQAGADEYVWDMVARGNVISDDVLKKRNQRRAAVNDTRATEFWRRWKVVNSSAGGYGLLWEADETSKAQVGELLALREREGNEYSWRVGVMRWMQFNQEEELHAGVQLLAPKTMLATIRPTDLSRKKEAPANALMLPGIKTIDQPPTLLTPTNTFSQGEDVVLELRDQERAIKLTEIAEQTGAFCQFRYVNIKEQKQSAVQQRKHDDGFDSLWSEL